MKKEFKMVAGWVMSVLGITSFAKDNDGKLFLTEEQKAKLEKKYGQQFVDGFSADLANMEVEGEQVNITLSAEEKLELEAGRIETAKLKAKIQALESEKTAFEATIAKLEKKPADAQGEKIEVSAFEQQLKKAGVDLSLKHNRFLADYMQGKVSAAYSGDSTIDTQELKQEFGKYVSSERMDILRGLFGQTESTQYMTSIITDKTEVRASQANIIGSVLQQFVPEWTPSGAAKFTPLTIKNFKHKLNVPIKPSDIMEDVIGYMYDEQAKQLQSMPIVRYILWQLVFPKLDEERETALAVGRYVESQPGQDGHYTASGPTESMDGYLTQLADKHAADAEAGEGDPTSGIRWLLEGVTLTDENIMEKIDAAVDAIAQNYPLYAKKKMFVHADPNLILKYQRAYRKEYPWLKNEDGDDRVKIDFSKFTFAPMEGMRSTGCFFITPKENFKHIMSHNPQNVTLRFVENHYSVDILGEWWEGTGFWMAEAIFAYIAPGFNEAAGDGGKENAGGGSNENAGGGSNENTGGVDGV